MSSNWDDTHSAVHIMNPESWVLYASNTFASRLIVFVHGFGGKALSSWQNFPDFQDRGVWWLNADMLFIGYKSSRDSITGVSSRIRRNLPQFYPSAPQYLLNIHGEEVRPDTNSRYEELVLVGHSLGGLILRHAMAQEAQELVNRPRDLRSAQERHPLLEGKLRLFSPASGGFRKAGDLAMLAEYAGIWPAVETWLRRASAYTDLQPGSVMLSDTRRRTELLAGGGNFDSLRADILWANPDKIVIESSYDTDYSSQSIDKKTHRSVCKPNQRYPEPWDFVESGGI